MYTFLVLFYKTYLIRYAIDDLSCPLLTYRKSKPITGLEKHFGVEYDCYHSGVPRFRQGLQTGWGRVWVGHQAHSKGDQKIIVESNDSYALAA
jgi:hypothetical protein